MAHVTYPVRVAHLTGVPTPSFIPLYRHLSSDSRIDLTVFYASSAGVRPYDGGFARQFTWDTDLTSGYRCVFLRRSDTTPYLGRFPWSVRNWDVVPILTRGRYDVLWMSGYNSFTFVLGAATQHALGGAVLVREEQTLLDSRPTLNHVVKHFALPLLFRRAQTLYVSSENRRWLQHFGVPDDRIYPAVYTVDNRSIQAAAVQLGQERMALRQEFGISDQSGPVITTVSRLIPKKQPLFVLEAFSRVREQEPCVLLIAGSGPMEQTLRAEVQRRRIPDVLFTGFLNKSAILKAYAVADIFTLLSRERETFGLVVAEAMNFRLPVVVSDRVGCASDLVSTDYNGYVVSARDPAEASNRLAQLVHDPDLRQKMGAASLRRIDEWTLERTAEDIVSAVTAAVSERS